MEPIGRSDQEVGASPVEAAVDRAAGVALELVAPAEAQVTGDRQEPYDRLIVIVRASPASRVLVPTWRCTALMV